MLEELLEELSVLELTSLDEVVLDSFIDEETSLLEEVPELIIDVLELSIELLSLIEEDAVDDLHPVSPIKRSATK